MSRRYGPKPWLSAAQKRFAQRARRLLTEAVRQGLVRRRLECERCKRRGLKSVRERYGIGPIIDAVQAHHPDYTQPLKVQWLCLFHHSLEHERMRRRGKSPYDRITPEQLQSFAPKGNKED